MAKRSPIQGAQKAAMPRETRSGNSPSTTIRVLCDRCRSRLEVLDTPSGGRTVSVVGLGLSVEANPLALERFEFGTGRDVTCPACNHAIDPSAPYRGALFSKPQRPL